MISSLISMLQRMRERARRRGVSTRGECLESRVLPTVDLALAGVSFHFTPSQTTPNTYLANFDFSITNNGTTTASLTGALFNSSDNVHIRAVFSTDAVYGNGDDVQIGDVVFRGVSQDNTNISLAPGGHQTISMQGTVTANPDNHYVLYKLDSTNVLSETNESNNVGSPQAGSAFNHIEFQPAGTQFTAGKTALLDFRSYVTDLLDTDYAGSTLTVALQGAKPGDLLNIQSEGVIHRFGSLIQLNHKTVATVSGGKRGTLLTVTFKPDSDNLTVNAILENLTFKSKKSQPGDRTVDLTLTTQSGQTARNSPLGNLVEVDPRPKHH